MNIKQIVEERLRKDGFDGLCCDGCNCRIDDLMSCGEPVMECRPGHIEYGIFEGIENTWRIVETCKGGERDERGTGGSEVSNIIIVQRLLCVMCGAFIGNAIAMAIKGQLQGAIISLAVAVLFSIARAIWAE